ncbi:MAG: EVE domain-containing protein [Pyrinomonadaceae bacterium]|jgi:predicted RNA-binding protein with PUA-like domain|nr:EVE domain-containing protein [Vibrio sp. 2033]MDW2127665.1 EVE domain-containing protein [Vibrio sp. 2033]
MNYWLVKQEPTSYSFDTFRSEKKTDWTGVRNYQARNNLRAMSKGDKVLYYHSGDERAVVGLAKVTKTAFPDPTDENWVAVELEAGKRLRKPVTLSEIKANPKLANIALVRLSRLSVVPLTEAEFDEILAMSETK